MRLLSEVQAMQNPALGAALIWRFACGYCPKDHGTSGVPLPLAFIVLPITLHARTLEVVQSTLTDSGLRKFEEKFKEQGDLLLALNERAISMRPLSMRSLRLALATGLVTLLPETATIWPRSYTAPPGTQEPAERLFKAAEKLGSWCASLSLFEVSGILRVVF